MKSLHLTRPRAIMMIGVPGSGKTFFANQFANTFRVPFIESEVINELGASRISSARLIALTLTEIAKTGQTFIIEGSGETKTLREEFSKFAHDHDYDPLFIWVQSDRTTTRQRSIRKGTAQATYLAALQRFEPPTEKEKALIISGRHTYASQARLVLNYIGSASRAQAEQHEREAPRVVPPAR